MSRRCCSIVRAASGGEARGGSFVLGGRMERDRIKAAKPGCRWWCTDTDLGAESWGLMSPQVVGWSCGLMGLMDGLTD